MEWTVNLILLIAHGVFLLGETVPLASNARGPVKTQTAVLIATQVVSEASLDNWKPIIWHSERMSINITRTGYRK